MRLRNLETFYWAATTGNFRETAGRLITTQAAISARTEAFERNLGATLFERRGRRVSLTRAGHQALHYAEETLAVADELATSTGDQSALSGTLRIGANETIIHTWFPGFLAALSKAYPNLNVEAHVDIAPKLAEGLSKRQMDIAFLVGPINGSGMVNRPVCAYRMVWVASPDYELPCWRLTKAEVAEQLIITFPRQTASTTNLISKLSGRSLPLLRINFANVLTAILHLVQSGLGLAERYWRLRREGVLSRDCCAGWILRSSWKP